MQTRLARTLRSTVRLSVTLAFVAAMMAAPSAFAASYTWTQNSVATQVWTNTSNWLSSSPYDSSTTNELKFFTDTTTALANGINSITTSVPSTLSMNVLTLNGLATSTAGTSTINIASSASTWTLGGTNPTVNLNGNNNAGKSLLYDVKANLTLLQTNTLFTGNGSAGFTFSGVISGSSNAITKTGTSTLTLSGVNTYSGTTTVSAGTLVLNNANAINNSAVTVASGATLRIGSNVNFNNTNAVTIAGTGAPGMLGALYLQNAVVWAAPIILNGNSTIFTFGGALSTTLNGAITGTGNLRLVSQGGSALHIAPWLLNAASSYSGTTAIVNADGLGDVTVKLGTNNALPTTTSLNLEGAVSQATNTFTTLDLNGKNQALAGLTDTNSSSSAANVAFGKRVINSSNTLSTLTLDIASGTNTYGTTGTRVLAGTIGGTTAGGVAANNLALTKTGNGTLVLAGNNTYTGATTLSAGTLSVATIGNGGVAGNLGQATSAASNLVFAGGALGYTGATASSDRSFTMQNAGVNSINVSNAASTLTLTGSSPTNTGLLQKDGAGGLTLDPGLGGSYSLGSINANGGTLTLKSGTVTTTGTDPTVAGYNISAGARNGGTLTVDGAALTVATGGTRRFVIGGASSGTGNLLSGSITAPEVYIGHNGAATMTQSGGTLTTTTLQHVDGGVATYAMTGGTLTARQIQYFTSITNGSGNSFTFSMNGGTVRAAAGTTDLFANNTSTGTLQMAVQLGSTGATIDTSLSSARIVRPLENMPSQAGTLTKIGDNTLTLSGTNTYTGATTVSAGTLLVDTGASVAASASIVNGGLLRVNGIAGSVTVNSGGSLGGSGTVGALTLNSGGLLNPGNSPGTLTAASAIVLGGSTYNWQITMLEGTAGTNWDLLSVTGLLDMSGVTSSSKWNLVVTGDAGFEGWTDTSSYSYVFAQAASVSGFSSTVGTDVTSLFNITTSGIASKPNASFTANGDFKVVVGSAGSLTTLNLMAIPEPSTGSLLGFGLGGLVVIRLLRRKQS